MDKDKKTLGQMIGKISHAMKITNGAGEVVSLAVDFDYSTMDDQSIKNLIVRSTTIDFARPTRSLSAAEIKKLSGTTIAAQNAGKKVKSRTETVEMIYQGFISTGMDEAKAREYANLAADNPRVDEITSGN